MDDSLYWIGVSLLIAMGAILIMMVMGVSLNSTSNDLTLFCIAKYGSPAIGVTEAKSLWCFEGIGDSKWISHEVVKTNSNYTVVGG